jgi:NAD(P)-dependent dehydrogenase (short-subunit alcohol dehydrogenase family)
VSAVVVTGASTGIGAEAARRLARAGFTVFAGVRDDAAAAALRGLDERIRPLRLDVTEPAQLGAAVETVTAHGEPLAALVANAGIAVGGPLEYLPLDQVRRQFEVNVFGALASAQAFLPQLHASRGRLVFVGSISGRLAVPLIGPYAASKFALRALADALRNELAPAGVAVALIEPGSVKTPIWAKGRASRDRLLGSLPPAAHEHYGAGLTRLFAQLDEQERGGMPVERVGDAILHAVTAPHARASYLLGTPARLGSIVAMLPARLRDRLLRLR